MLSTLLSHGHDIRRLGAVRGSSALHCLTSAVGYEQRKAEIYSWDGMARGTSPFLVLQHTVLGEGRLSYAGTDHHLRPGQTMLVTIPQAHRYWLDRGGHWEYFWAVLHGREALRLAREILEVRGPVLEIGPAAVDRLAAACLTLLTDMTLTAGTASSAAYAALTALHDSVFDQPGPPAPTLPAALSRVVDHIERNLATKLSVDRLAERAGLSRAHFVRVFTAALGQPPSDYVQTRRMERVERLLLASEMTVADIARACGFADPNYLAKVFRRHRGMAPLDYRATRAEAS
jgi:AraC family transcriptional regulator